ncbi:MAG: transporter substrate-binding domain-containing protein, partial [Lentisphaerae bacterium]|nr:transporter substrate-binding domain-containing protein [Lentisphaerota bacterium]
MLEAPVTTAGSLYDRLAPGTHERWIRQRETPASAVSRGAVADRRHRPRRRGGPPSDIRASRARCGSRRQLSAYIFLNEQGAMRGILPDQWALWSQKTGRKVDLRPMDWAEAQRAMREGRADVIDTMFLTEERSRHFAFTRSYARIPVPVYAHRSLGGLADVDGLKGFMIGVKAGDAVIERLQRNGIDTLREYPGYEEIIFAAKRNEIKVFSVDEPAAEYYLYKHGIAGDYRQAFVLYTGEFHRAVARNRTELLHEVQRGFDRISSREYRAIRRKWMGATFLLKGFLLHWAPWLAGLAAAVLLLAAGNVILGHRVHAKTAELRRALADIRRSLDARLHAEEETSAMQRQLANVQKLESIGRLAGAVAHDFNNVLQAILGYSELALGQVSETHPLRNVIEEIRKSALRSSNLTRQLQAFARRQPMSPQPVDIKASIEGMSSLLCRLL